MAGKALRMVLLMSLSLWFAAAAHAHPMGNFSINHYSRITVDGNSIQLEYFIDMAEIPTYQELQDAGIEANEQDAKLAAYLTRKAEIFKKGLLIEVDGKPLQLETIRSNAIFPPGAGGLLTMKSGFVYRAALPADAARSGRLHLTDNNFAGRAGWKEVVATAGEGATLLSSSVPEKDRSNQLSNYPTDPMNSAPQELEASLTFSIPTVSPNATPLKALGVIAAKVQPKAGSGSGVNENKQVGAVAVHRRTSVQEPVIPPPPGVGEHANAASQAEKRANEIHLTANRQATPRSAFTELITRQDLSLWFLITAAFIAMALGGLHALEPGHGKTLVAAYLVGSRGKAHHAVLLGVIVTLAHTAGVYALGVITLFASRYILPEKIYPWLGVISGLSVSGIAAMILLRRWNNGAAVEDHTHWYERFTKPGNATDMVARRNSGQESGGAVSLPQLLVLGITGGLVPCPAALVVLLSALALHRIGFGLFLIVSFSVGLATVLVSIGLMMVYAGRLMKRFGSEGRVITVWLPLASSLFMMVLGLALTVQSFRTTHLTLALPHFLDTRFLLLLLLGIFFGIRHSTDADHVVAVTTIVTRLRSLRQASLVGMLWGVGHTITIFIVGSAIILFGVVIPPRLGLSMEFGVALMLILLGLLNLTGWMQRITNRFTRERSDGVFELTAATSLSQPDHSAHASAGVSAQAKGGILALYRQFGSYHLFRPLVIGLVHGLAGSAAVALLVLATIKNPTWAIAYLLLFGAGTVIGMMGMTGLIALPIVYSEKHFHQSIPKYMGLASGVVSLAFGMFLSIQIGYVDGLFSAVPNWTPK